MRILITGGAGFIGSHVQDAYLQAGHEVAVLDDFSSGKKANIAAGVKVYECDIRSDQAAQAIADFRPEVLNMHAAQMDVRRSVEDPKYDLEVNGLGILNLLESARLAGVQKVIFASSGGAIYGEQENFPASETSPTHPESPYGITKLLADKYLHFYQQTYGLSYVSLRYGNVYGPRQDPHGEAGVVAIFIGKMLKGEVPIIYGDGEQTRDYVFVGDVAQANVLALSSQAQGIYNVGTGVETSVNELYTCLANLLDFKQAAQREAGRAGEQRRSVVDAKLLREHLKWKSKYPLELGLKEIIKYFK